MTDFKELGLRQELLQAIAEQGYEHPMPVQEQVIPWLLGSEECDLVALAQTGTGKTAAYGLPLLQRLVTEFSEYSEYSDNSDYSEPLDFFKRSDHPSMVILSPTRELCLQIADDLQGFAKYLPEVRILAVYGGANIEPQIRALKHGVEQT